jgi:GABA permease
MRAQEEARGGEELRRGLSMRHTTMIAIGGIIGGGLFVGSGAVIGQAGPAAILAYALGGLLVVLVMRMLGEMAAARPSVGSFSQYARDSLGGWAGFASGWLYWYLWVFVVAYEAVVGAQVIREFVPGVPLWTFSLAFMVLFVAANLLSVRYFGETEFWLASIKVAVIIGFLALGTLYVVGLWPGSDPGLASLATEGGFVPNGWLGVLNALVVVIFSYFGAEIVSVTAAESREPAQSVARATSSLVWRVLIFYIGSILLILAIIPWNEVPTDGSSPFAAAIGRLGIPFAVHLMNFVVLTAVLSVLNSGIYVASRMLFALAGRGDAPRAFRRVSRRGVPYLAILVSSAVGFLSVIAAYVSPDTIFLFLANSTGVIAVFIYLFIAFSQLRMRSRLERESPEGLRVRMWLHPYLTYASIVALLAVLISMVVIPGTRSQILLSLSSLGVILAIYGVRALVGGRPAEEPRADSGAVPTRNAAGPTVAERDPS